MGFTPKLFEDILNDMISWVTNHTTKITDFNEGSITRALLGAIAVALEEGYFDILLGWKDAMRYAIQKSLNFEKVTGSKATGNVIFSRATAAPQTYPIAIGTVVATVDGVRFVTTEAGEISIGNTDSASISVEAESVGEDGNVAADTINQLVSIPAGIESVNNSAATLGGVNEETDEAYEARFALYIQGLAKATPPGIKSGALSVAGVFDAYVYEDPLNPGTVVIYIDDGSGTATPALIEGVKDVLEGDGTVENPGYRPAGIVFLYGPADKVTQNITATVYYDAGSDEDQIEADVEEAISTYINTLSIGDDIVVAEIIDAAMGVLGVRDISITVPAANVAIDAANGEVAKYGTGTYTMTQYIDQP